MSSAYYHASTRQVKRAGLWFGLAALAASLALVAVEHLEFFFNGKVGSSLTFDAVTTAPSLAGALVAWLGGVLVLYVGSGWLVARAFCEVAGRLPVASDQRVSASLLLQVVVAGWVLLLNARLFPNSLFARGFVDFVNTPAGTWVLRGVGVALAGLAVAAVLAMVLRWMRAGVGGGLRLAVAAVLGVAVAVPLFGLTPGTTLAPAAAGNDRPNVVLIGIDSLRPDHLGMNGFPIPLMPAIDEFLAGAMVFDDTITPLARTFPAWMSILTGSEPVAHGARFNLVPDTSTVQVREQNLARWLGDAGYTRIFATDERRFSNIDERFGFDTVVAPPMGAADFLIGGLNDLPLSNLLSNTAIGRRVFPYNHGNRAAAATYRPDSFVAMLDDGLEFDADRPVFVATHLCLAHWPFTWASTGGMDTDELPEPFSDTRPEYLETLRAVDRQFEALLDILDRRGVLDNAIVVVLSDHGESFSMTKDRLEPGAGSALVGPVTEAVGHGTSVTALSQHQVLLALRRFGGDGSLEAGRVPGPVSLVDIAPTVLDLLGLAPPAADLDGRSLVAGPVPTDRVLTVESGFSIPAMMQLIPDPQETIRQSAQFYTVDRNGRLTIDERFLDDLTRNKERAVVSGDWMLSVVPRGEALVRKIVHRHSRRAWDESTLAASGAPVSRLTRSFCERFGADVGVAGSDLCRPETTVAAGE